MEPDLQVRIVKQFMLAIAPIIVRHCLRSDAYDQEGQLQSNLASQTAQLTLELSMHLAAKYATCYDSVHEAKPTKPKVKTPRGTDETLRKAES